MWKVDKIGLIIMHLAGILAAYWWAVFYWNKEVSRIQK